MNKTLRATLFASLFVLASPILHADDFTEGQLLQKKAEAGDKDAAAALGVLGNIWLLNANSQRQVAGFLWLLHAAELGDIDSQRQLGTAYDKGDHPIIKEDDGRAVKYYLRAAKQGDAPSQLRLGEMYAVGNGVKTDYAEALKWAKKPIEGYSEDAMRDLIEKQEALVSTIERVMAPDKDIFSIKSKADSSKSSKKSQYFVDNGDGTVTDKKTKLVWKQCSEGQSGKDCSGDATRFEWVDATTRFGKSVSFAGHDDWRMPTKDELLSLTYCTNTTRWDVVTQKRCGSEDTYPSIDSKVFPNTDSSFYWSSTEKDGTSVWGVDFDKGGEDIYGRISSQRVRLVRSVK